MKGIRAMALLCVLAASTTVEGHRLDEYLQAARVDIAPDRIELPLELTPGVAIAPRVLAEIDLDGDRTISAAEADGYARRILGGLSLDVDGQLLTPALVDHAFPRIEDVVQGNGIVRLRFVAMLPRLGDGPHHLRYRNANRTDIGVYLANALVPASDRVSVTDQRRSINQQELIVDYTLRAEAPSSWRSFFLAGIVAAIGLTGWWFWPRLNSRAGRPPDPPRPAV